jgi:hypothetical protein
METEGQKGHADVQGNVDLSSLTLEPSYKNKIRLIFALRQRNLILQTFAVRFTYIPSVPQRDVCGSFYNAECTSEGRLWFNLRHSECVSQGGYCIIL